VLSCVGFTPAVSAELVRVPHTFVSLSPPPGFTATRAFGGFENRRAGWLIEVLELGPELWPEYAAAFSSPERATAMFDVNGIRITRIEQLALDSGEVPLAIGVSKAFGRETLTYMALMGDRGTATVLITFGLSRSSPLGRSDVEAVLRSVKIDAPTTLAEWLAVLPFTFREVPPFHTTLARSGPTRASSGFARLAAFDAADQSAKTLTIQIRWTPTDIPVETAQTNAILIPGVLNSREVTIVEPSGGVRGRARGLHHGVRRRADGRAIPARAAVPHPGAVLGRRRVSRDRGRSRGRHSDRELRRAARIAR
jgi:hypothetical protein